ncbi:(2Fe-2S)-binding protein [Rhodococcus sp. NPDC060084]|uniref:(2Fe-2S)-binding protein n=1 Tax=Rhodococcus sp. NPDC060084 TaxID=3347053 RepID=UPI00366347BB
MQSALIVNGTVQTVCTRPGDTLLDVLRSNGHTAPKGACGRGECGACTVLVGDRAVLSCVTLAATVTAPVTTATGLAESARDLRESFADCAGFQCGFCTPGQIARAEAVLREAALQEAGNRCLSRDEIAAAMSGNICRCTGYVQIVDAVHRVAASRLGEETYEQ